MNNCQGNTLRRVFSINQIRAHECPNCKCISHQLSYPHDSINLRQLSPSNQNINTFLIPQKIENIAGSSVLNPSVLSQNNYFSQGIKKYRPIQDNIYFKRTDLFGGVNKNQSLNKSNTSKNSCQRSIGQQNKYNINSNTSHKIFSPPYQHATTNLNIRYVSPGKNNPINNLQIHSNPNNHRQNVEYIRHKQQYKNSLYYNRPLQRIRSFNDFNPNTGHNIQNIQKTTQNVVVSQNEDEPKVPSILRKKNSQRDKEKSRSKMKSPQFVNKLSKNEPSLKIIINQKKVQQEQTQTLNCENKNQKVSYQLMNEVKIKSHQNSHQSSHQQKQSKRKFDTIKQLQLGTVSSIISRNAIKSYPQFKTQQTNLHKVKGKWDNPSTFDILLDHEYDKVIANQITKDLKLNYQYYETTDISQLSKIN